MNVISRRNLNATLGFPVLPLLRFWGVLFFCVMHFAGISALNAQVIYPQNNFMINQPNTNYMASSTNTETMANTIITAESAGMSLSARCNA